MKTIAIALVLFAAGCGTADQPAATDQPAAAIAAYQWYATVTGPNWECSGFMGFSGAAGSTATGEWSCNDTLRFPSTPTTRVYFTGPVSATLNGASVQVTLAKSPSEPTAYSAVTTMTNDALTGTVTINGVQAAFVATKV